MAIQRKNVCIWLVVAYPDRSREAIQLPPGSYQLDIEQVVDEPIEEQVEETQPPAPADNWEKYPEVRRLLESVFGEG